MISFNQNFFPTPKYSVYLSYVGTSVALFLDLDFLFSFDGQVVVVLELKRGTGSVGLFSLRFFSWLDLRLSNSEANRVMSLFFGPISDEHLMSQMGHPTSPVFILWQFIWVGAGRNGYTSIHRTCPITRSEV